MASAGLKRTLLLTTLPDEQLELLAEEGQLGEVDIDLLPETPYVELQKQVNDLKKGKSKDDDALAAAENKLEKANKRIADLTGILSKDDQEVVDQLRKAKDGLEGYLAQITAMTDHLGPRLSSHSPTVRAEYIALYEWLVIRAKVTNAEARIAAGEQVYSDEYLEAMRAPRPLMGPNDPYELLTKICDEDGENLQDVLHREAGDRENRAGDAGGTRVLPIHPQSAADIEAELIEASEGGDHTNAESVARRRAALRAVRNSLPAELLD